MINNAIIGRGEYDWQAGANSPIIHKVLLKGGNWKELSIPNEIQVVNYGESNTYDTSMCVSYNSVCLPIAYILMEMLRQNMIPAETSKWLKEKGYFVNGSINFSERFVGVLGETKSNGAYQYKVANAAKNFGLVPEHLFPMADNFNDNIDPKFVTQELLDLGKEFLTHLALNYEWVNPNDTEEYLQYSPNGCIGQFANYNKPDDILDPPTKKGHAMCEVNETDEYKEIDDSYWQQFKKYKKDKLQSFMAWYITPLKTTMDTQKWVKDNDKKWVQISAGEGGGQFGRVLQGKLTMFVSSDRGALALLDDKMRTEPSVKITSAEFKQLKDAELVINF